MKMNLLEAVEWVEQQPPGTTLTTENGAFRLARSVRGVDLEVNSFDGWGRSSQLREAAKATWPRPRRKADYLAALRVVKEDLGRAFYNGAQLRISPDRKCDYFKTDDGDQLPTIDQKLDKWGWEIEDTE